MKKLMFLFVALTATVALAYAEPEIARERYSNNYGFRDFTKLSVSNAFKVELYFENRYEVSVDVPDWIEPYLKVIQKGDRVSIGLKQLPASVQRKLNKDNTLTARVAVPKLTSLHMSGASSVTPTGMLSLGDETLFIDISGAAKLNSLVAEGRGRCDIEMSGACKAVMELSFKNLVTDVSGASNLNLNGSADKLAIECSGASNAIFNGDYNIVKAEVSGASDATVNGDADNLSLEVSGASGFECTGISLQVRAELSGASKARVTVTESLEYDLSGASTLKVKNMRADVSGETSRGSKLVFIK